MTIGVIRDRGNYSHMRFFGPGVSMEGELISTENEVEILQLVKLAKPLSVNEEGQGNFEGHKIVVYLLDGNILEITGVGTGNVMFTQVIDNVTYRQVVDQPKLRSMLDSHE